MSSLRLVWVNEGLLMAKNKNKQKQLQPQSKPEPKADKSRLFGWAFEQLGIPKWGQLFIFLLIIFFAPLYYKTFFSPDGRIDKLMDKVSNVESEIAGIKQRIIPLERDTYGTPQAKAKAVGFSNPSIVRVNFTPGYSFNVEQKTPKTYFLRLEILEITKDSITVRFDAKTATGSTYEDNRITVPFQVGIPFQLMGRGSRIYFHDLPDVYMMILEKPVKNTALVAIGTRTEDKTS